MDELTVCAVDLGATSGRVVAVRWREQLALREVHRFANGPVPRPDGSQRWDWSRIITEVRTGLDHAIADGPVASIGVDAWGCDYGLLDEDGELLSAPYAYRDARTEGWQDVVDRLGAERIYATTGIQFMPVNTLYQLAAHDRRELEAAHRFVMVPELVVYDLTGSVCGELTSASTTQVLDAHTRQWSGELLSDIGVEAGLFPEVMRAGTRVGEYRGVPVHLVGGHDTASAVAAVPSHRSSFTAYLSSGTWSLVGVELDRPETSEGARAANFTNEAGVFGNIRFLRNVMGLWMFDELRREWEMSIADAVDLAERAKPGPVVDAADQRYLNPLSMEVELRTACPDLPDDRGAVLRCVFDSLAAAYARTVDDLGSVLGRQPDRLRVIGGGSQLAFLNELTERACGIPVEAGPVEATALGNALVQMIALGVFPGLEQGREAVRALTEHETRRMA